MMTTDTFESVIESLFSDLENSPIQYCVWRGYTGLPHEISGSDIDILVDSIDNRLTKLLETHGFVRARRTVFGGVPVVYTRYLPEEDLWIPLHIITPRPPGHVKLTPDEFNIYTTLVNGIRSPKPEMEFIILTLTGISAGYTTEKRYTWMRKLLGNKNIEIETYLEILAQTCGKSSFLYERLKNPNPRSIFDDNYELTRELVWKVRYSPLLFIRKLYWKLFYTFERYILNPNGYRIAVSGIDGSGKSTLIDNLIHNYGGKRELFKKSRMATESFPVILSGPMRFMQRRLEDQSNILKKIIWHLLLPVQLITDTLSLWWIYLKSSNNIFRGHHVLFDRYAFFHVLKRTRCPHDKLSWIRKAYIKIAELLFIRLFPGPDKILHIKLTPEEARKRKQEDPLEYLNCQSQWCSFLLEHYYEDLVIELNGNSPPDTMRKKLIRDHWEELARR